MPPYSKVLSETTQISYHQQEFGDWCGAACAQMILHSLAFDAPFFRQADLKLVMQSPGNCREPGIKWTSAPDALTRLLNSTKPGSFTNQFRLVRGQTAQETTRRIIWNIERFNMAAIALVHGFKHWVLVRGFTVSKQPLGPDDSTYDILFLDLYDPGPAMPVNKPGIPGWAPPHTVGDSCPSEFPHGHADGHVTYSLWAGTPGNTVTKVNYLTGIPATIASTWAGKFLAICIALPGEDPTEMGCETVLHALGDDFLEPMAALEDDFLEPDENAEDATPDLGDRDRRMNDSTPHFDAIENAKQGLEDFGLLERANWKQAKALSTPDEPLLVHRLDDPNGSYLIVPFRNANQIPLLVMLDADTGEYLQAEAASKPDATVRPMLSSEAIKAQLRENPVTIGQRTLVIDPKQLPEGDLPLVWKPCVESFSPFVPFYMVALEMRGRPLTLYVRVSDGAVFARLTDDVGGA